ncbi:MAG: hypothetical protein RJQ04_01055 [Longimicrobiales bacterium]
MSRRNRRGGAGWTRMVVGGLGAVGAMLASGAAAAQELDYVAWDDPRWTMDGEATTERFLGREALVLQGDAWLDVDLEDGRIVFDVAGTSELGFYGIAFRAADDRNYEHFYVRPFQTGRPDATQYTPVYNGLSGWQLYTGEAYGQAVDIPHERWVRVEMAFRDQRLDVWVDGQHRVFPVLDRPARSGRIAITASGQAPGRFSEFRMARGAPVATTGEGPRPAPVPDGAVRVWSVSSPFAEALLEGGEDLADMDRSGLSWSTLKVGPGGIMNVARLHPRTPEANTVLARVVLEADEATVVRAPFGFSDRVGVFLNGERIYSGRAEWRSQDHRFLGTVGLFDEVSLRLRPGRNEVVLALSESFGGWGGVLQIDAPGVRVVRP